MKFLSTRGKAPAISFEEGLQKGLASDGGLYVPERFPSFDLQALPKGIGLAELSALIAREFFEGPLKAAALDLCTRVFDFPLPLTALDPSTKLLELFHGPTAAFKDVGARFLAECLSRGSTGADRTVLVATSGDTGGAVAAAFDGRPGFSVAILYPRGMVSKLQEAQLTCWGSNVRAFSVRGTFDDCQRIAKEAFLDSRFSARKLLSANSINIGRILPQSFYYAWASTKHFQETGRRPGFVVPSGNLGNAVAALWARKMGFPISKVVLACNANRAVPEYFKTGRWEPRATEVTLANAMDVGNASNFERLRHLYPALPELRDAAAAYSASDDELRAAIGSARSRWKCVVCPHTAAGVAALGKLPAQDWILVATAHAAKFPEVIEPVLGAAPDEPPSFQRFRKRPGKGIEIEPTVEALLARL